MEDASGEGKQVSAEENLLIQNTDVSHCMPWSGQNLKLSQVSVFWIEGKPGDL